MPAGDMRRIFVSISCLLLGTAVCAAEPGSEISGEEASPTRVEQLVSDLGHDEFARREQATEQLIRIGLPATELLEAGLAHADREIRYRSARILIIVRERDFQRRLDAFLTVTDKSHDHQLPGWSAFSDRLGDSNEIRELFVEMQKAEPDLLAALEKGTKEAATSANLRSQQLQASMGNPVFQQQLSLGSISAVLFVAGLEDVILNPAASNSLYAFCYQPAFRNAIKLQSQSDVLKKLLSAWIRKGEGWTAYQGLHLAMQYDLPDGLIPAKRVLDNFAQNQLHVKMNAILVVAKFGDERHIDLIEPLLEDKMPYGGSQRVGGKQYTTQIRDVALATLWRLVKEDPQKHGFNRLQMHPQVVFNTSSIGFADDKQRSDARTQWDTFRKAK